MLKRASFKPTIQEILKSKITRIISAIIKPIARALPCLAFGSFPAIMEIKMILSIPNTISNTDKVSKLMSDATVKSSLKSWTKCIKVNFLQKYGEFLDSVEIFYR
jgi:hypothetical protein